VERGTSSLRVSFAMAWSQWFQGKKLTNPIEKAALSIQQAFDGNRLFPLLSHLLCLHSTVGEIFPETLSTIFERDCYVLRDKV
jgi:hypothetical protein